MRRTSIDRCPRFSGPKRRPTPAQIEKIIVLAVLTAAGTAHAQQMQFGERSFRGHFDYNGITHVVIQPLDQVRYGSGSGHNAYIQPEEYQALRSIQPPFQGPGFRIDCPELDGTGLKGFAGSGASTECSWTAGSGNSAPTGTFALTLAGAVSPRPSPTFYQSLAPDSFTIQGALCHPVDGTFPISLTYDVVTYRSSTDHTAYIRGQFGGNRIDVSSLANTGIRLTSCDAVAVNGIGTDGFFGQEPVVVCQWKKGNGSQPPENFGSVTLTAGGSLTCPGCATDADCDDSVSCTVDACTAGQCSNTADDALCGPLEVCDAASGCQFVPQCTTNADCADDNVCTSGEFCDNGVCIVAVTFCPVVECDPVLGCERSCAVNDDCDNDGNACTNQCVNGSCQFGLSTLCLPPTICNPAGSGCITP